MPLALCPYTAWMQNPLPRQQAFNDLVISVLARFAAGAGAEIDDCIRDSLREISQFIGVDYALVIQTVPDLTAWSVTHEWCAPEVPSRAEDYQNVPMGTFDWSEQVLLAGQAVIFNCLEDAPPTAAAVRRQWESLGFQSTLQLPLRGRGGVVCGCIVLSSIFRKITWTDDDVQRLRLLAEAIANAVQRTRAETNLRESEAQYRATFEYAPVGIARISLQRRLLTANQSFFDMLGYPAADILGKHLREVTQPEDWEASDRLYEQVLADRVSLQSLEKRYLRKDGSVVWGNVTLSLVCGAAGEPQAFVAAIEDITARKQAETELREALKEVERLTDRLRAENVYLQEEIARSHGFDEIVGDSEPLRLTLTKIEHVADTDASVLLLGETGTGKELLARAIHNHSRRKDRPLVKVNLAALPSSLIESELFGHVKGAFTGAVSDKVGRFELANGGTLFLDEIGELGPELQTKLLRVLQEGEFERIGSSETIRVNIRVVSATNRNLHQAMDEGKFRPDLYYRLAVFPVEVPPLRMRREDIPLLVWHFIAKKQGRLAKTITRVPAAVMKALVDYDWPGNIRELENVLERGMILASGQILLLEESFKRTRRHLPASPSRNPAHVDRAAMIRALEDSGWRIKGAGNAAERLGLKPSTLRYRMKVLGVRRPTANRRVVESRPTRSG